MSAKQRKQKKPLFREFESSRQDGRFVKIAWDMMQSKAWSDLTVSQRGLYLMMKAEYLPEKSNKGVLLPASGNRFTREISENGRKTDNH